MCSRGKLGSSGQGKKNLGKFWPGLCVCCATWGGWLLTSVRACVFVALRAHKGARNLRGGAWRAKAVHLDLRVGLVLVMNLGRLARAKCVPQQGVGRAALGLCDLRPASFAGSTFLVELFFRERVQSYVVVSPVSSREAQSY